MIDQMEKTDINQSIHGIGTDIIEIERIRKAIKRHNTSFQKKLFTIKEQHYCLKHRDPAPFFAGRFAAKEAIAKALGTGIGNILSFVDIEIINDDKGKPIAHFSDPIHSRFGALHILLSISHCKLFATAVAIWI